MDEVAIVIPVRMKSSRLPGKPLAEIDSMSVVEHVWRNVIAVYDPKHVYVAYDCNEIADVVQKFGGNGIATDENHPSGTDRIAEAMRKIKNPVAGKDYKTVVNFQGDGLNVDPRLNNKLIEIMAENNADIVTVATQISGAEDINNPAMVKIAMNNKGRALYFSRSPIPYDRDNNSVTKAFWHIGIYVYNVKSLQKFVEYPEGDLEKLEKLEQLRALENNMLIYASVVQSIKLLNDVPADINTPEELAEAQKHFTRSKVEKVLKI